MLDHHIQKHIVYTLAFTDSLRFSDLKPDYLENKAFDYHLKKVMRAGLVAKTDDGRYSLTSEGKRIGKSALTKPKQTIDRAYSIILLAVQRPTDNAWLLVRRRSQPLLNMIGLPQTRPNLSQTTLETASDTLSSIGLAGNFTIHGHGFFRIARSGEMESFTHFTLLKCTDIQGELRQNTELVEYYWDTDPDWQAPDMLPNMQTLRKMSQAPAGSFVEQTFYIE